MRNDLSGVSSRKGTKEIREQRSKRRDAMGETVRGPMTESQEN